MSYGVIASKSCQVMAQPTGGESSSTADLALDRFSQIWGVAWVPGRITLTRLHVNVIPHRAGRGLAMLDLRLADIRQVELQGGRVGTKLIGFRTDSHLLTVRMLGAQAFAEKIAALVQSTSQA